jgi:threonine dehydratase
MTTTTTTLPTLDDIRAAAARIAPYVRRTPTLPLRPTYDTGKGEIIVKLESLQHTGSFKPRGAFNKMLSLPAAELARGVAAVSGGNHGLGVAFAARTLGATATLFLPDYASPTKQQRIAALGAKIVLSETIAQCFERIEAFCAETGAAYVHPYADPLVIAGQGTVGLEFLEDAGGLDTLMVAIGGGGLISGIAIAAAALRPGLRVYGVEPSGAAAMYRAREAGKPVRLERLESVAADSLGAPEAAPITLEVVRHHVTDLVLMPDEAIVEAQRWLWRELNVVAEPGGCAALAAWLTGAIPSPGRAGVLVCGGNAEIGW